jgi:hypothetical protein
VVICTSIQLILAISNNIDHALFLAKQPFITVVYIL